MSHPTQIQEIHYTFSRGTQIHESNISRSPGCSASRCVPLLWGFKISYLIALKDKYVETSAFASSNESDSILRYEIKDLFRSISFEFNFMCSKRSMIKNLFPPFFRIDWDLTFLSFRWSIGLPFSVFLSLSLSLPPLLSSFLTVLPSHSLLLSSFQSLRYRRRP